MESGVGLMRREIFALVTNLPSGSSLWIGQLILVIAGVLASVGFAINIPVAYFAD